MLCKLNSEVEPNWGGRDFKAYIDARTKCSFVHSADPTAFFHAGADASGMDENPYTVQKRVDTPLSLRGRGGSV